MIEGMMQRVRIASLILAIVAPAAAVAQGSEGGYPQEAPQDAPQYGPRGRGAPVVLFEDYQQRGASFAVRGAIDSLDGTGFNDRAHSLVVYAGTWQLCANAHYSGDCKVFGPGTYNSLGDLTAKLSSLRPISGRPGYPSPGYPPSNGYPPPAWSDARVILYSGTDFGGREYAIGGAVRNLDRLGFNDRARSLRVERGYWLFCSDSDFGGSCRTFGPGDYPNLPPVLDRRISSGRQIDN